MPQFQQTSQTISTAPIDILWQTVTHLPNISFWHPFIKVTDVSRGVTAKPGLVYRIMPQLLPFPIQIFVERLAAPKCMSIRLFPIPGLEERVVYQFESIRGGTRVTYSIWLRGWLAPVAWACVKPLSAGVVRAIAQTAETMIDSSATL